LASSPTHPGCFGRSSCPLMIVLALVVAYMVAEVGVVGGLLTGSLALLAEAGYMLSDAASMTLALFALWLAQRPTSARHTYGYYRGEILVALVNGAALIAISIYIFVEVARRFSKPHEIQGAP
jgi:cobalt-zinc-cadmium efflux system protein